MNYKDNIVVGVDGMFDGIPPGVIKPSPIPLNAATEDDLFHERQQSRRVLQTNLQHHTNERQPHISQQHIMNQNGREFNRGNQALSQPLQHIPQPMPRVPPSISGGIPLHDQGNLAILQLIHQDPFSQELLKIPEAITLQTVLNNGDVDPSILLNQVLVRLK